MKEAKYAVLEWVDRDSDSASVIATDQSFEVAQTIVDIAPTHLYRETLPMNELKINRKLNKMRTRDDMLYEKYPRVAASAEIYNFNYEDIDTMLSIFDQSTLKEYMLTPELSLKALLVRLDVQRESFKDEIAKTFSMDLEDQIERVGEQQIPYLHELYYRR